MVWEKVNENVSQTYTKEYSVGDTKIVYILDNLIVPETTHCMKVRIECQENRSEWSDVGEITTPKFKEWCVWKRPSGNDDSVNVWSVNDGDDEKKKNPRVATRIGGEDGYYAIPGSVAVPPGRVVSWDVKVLKFAKDRDGIYVGVMPFDASRNSGMDPFRCGWYFNCRDSTLWSGPPHNYSFPGKKYGPWMLFRKTIKDGSIVSVVIDTSVGTLSYSVSEKSYGIAYEGIPLDKPLVPCVLLRNEGDSVELNISEVKENVVDSSISTPPNIIVKNGLTWDSVVLTWDPVEGASFYQIETDGSKFWGASTTNAFTKRGLPPETEHTIRVRTVRGNTAGEWSDVVKERTQRKTFETSWWKESPDCVHGMIKYSVDMDNPRIVTKIGPYGMCTIIGNTPLPLNKVTSWCIRILKSKKNDGDDISIGVAPFNINQNEDNTGNCGWYFDCYESRLYSGPSHNYRDEKYGPRKEKGQYVHTEDSVGVVMDTVKGELSFVLGGVNLGVAFEGIPLDKPLVPCAILRCPGDSVELDTSEMKETIVDSSIPVLSNIIAKGTAWDSITFTWDVVEGASFYQVETDGSKSWDASTANTFTKEVLLPDTEHTFRVRAVRKNSVSEWSDVVKGRTLKAPSNFSECDWKECPDNVDWSTGNTLLMRRIPELQQRLVNMVNPQSLGTQLFLSTK